MKLKCYSIFDRVVSSYGVPFFAVNDEDCGRRIAISYRDNPLARDCQLYSLGTFDQSTAHFVSKVDFVGEVSNIVSSYFPVKEGA